MKLSIVSVFSVTSALCIAALGCDKPTGEQASQTHLTSARLEAPPVSTASIEAIAAARCDREEICENVGAGRTYSNRDACMNGVRAKNDDSLTTSACPHGIDTAKMQTCLAEIRTERCDNPLDTLGRLSACRTDSLCQSASAGAP